MTDFLKQAIELTKAQASIRTMTEEEMMQMVTKLTAKLQSMASGEEPEQAPAEEVVAAIDPKKSIKEKSIVCCECGKVMKVITKKHLALHGLDAVSYREKYGLKKGTPLTSKELARARRVKMQEMKLWEKRAIAREAQKRLDFGSIEDL